MPLPSFGEHRYAATQHFITRRLFRQCPDELDITLFVGVSRPADICSVGFTYLNSQRFDAADWFAYAIFNDFKWNPLSLHPTDYVLLADLNFLIRDLGGRTLQLQTTTRHTTISACYRL